MSQNRVIGISGTIPWHIPEDFKLFKHTTSGHMIIMGRKTHESIGHTLPHRLNIIVSRTLPPVDTNERVVKPSIENALEFASSKIDQWNSEIFIIGGEELYRQTLPLTQRIYLTLVHKDVKGDTFYPEFDNLGFKALKNEPHLDASTPFTFTVFERRLP